MVVYEVDSHNPLSGIRFDHTFKYRSKEHFLKRERANRPRRKSGICRYVDFEDCKSDLDKFTKECFKMIPKQNTLLLKRFPKFRKALKLMNEPEFNLDHVLKKDSTYSILGNNKIIPKIKL